MLTEKFYTRPWKIVCMHVRFHVKPHTPPVLPTPPRAHVHARVCVLVSVMVFRAEHLNVCVCVWKMESTIRCSDAHPKYIVSAWSLFTLIASTAEPSEPLKTD